MLTSENEGQVIWKASHAQLNLVNNVYVVTSFVRNSCEHRVLETFTVGGLRKIPSGILRHPPCSFSSNNNQYKCIWEHAVVQLVEALRYKPEGHGFNSRWCHWNFSLT